MKRLERKYMMQVSEKKLASVQSMYSLESSMSFESAIMYPPSKLLHLPLKTNNENRRLSSTKSSREQEQRNDNNNNMDNDGERTAMEPDDYIFSNYGNVLLELQKQGKYKKLWEASSKEGKAQYHRRHHKKQHDDNDDENDYGYIFKKAATTNSNISNAKTNSFCEKDERPFNQRQKSSLSRLQEHLPQHHICPCDKKSILYETATGTNRTKNHNGGPTTTRTSTISTDATQQNQNHGEKNCYTTTRTTTTRTDRGTTRTFTVTDNDKNIVVISERSLGNNSNDPVATVQFKEFRA